MGPPLTPDPASRCHGRASGLRARGDPTERPRPQLFTSCTCIVQSVTSSLFTCMHRPFMQMHCPFMQMQRTTDRHSGRRRRPSGVRPGRRGPGFRGRGAHGGDSTVGGVRVSHCIPFIRADQGPLCGSSGLENKGKQDRCTDLRFLGGSRREGEGFTRIPESSFSIKSSPGLVCVSS